MQLEEEHLDRLGRPQPGKISSLDGSGTPSRIDMRNYVVSSARRVMPAPVS
jgi:hypothetical protein